MGKAPLLLLSCTRCINKLGIVVFTLLYTCCQNVDHNCYEWIRGYSGGQMNSPGLPGPELPVIAITDLTVNCRAAGNTQGGLQWVDSSSFVSLDFSFLTEYIPRLMQSDKILCKKPSTQQIAKWEIIVIYFPFDRSQAGKMMDDILDRNDSSKT